LLLHCFSLSVVLSLISLVSLERMSAPNGRPTLFHHQRNGIRQILFQRLLRWVRRIQFAQPMLLYFL
jgi:hypothetical protein